MCQTCGNCWQAATSRQTDSLSDPFSTSSFDSPHLWNPHKNPSPFEFNKHKKSDLGITELGVIQQYHQGNYISQNLLLVLVTWLTDTVFLTLHLFDQEMLQQLWIVSPCLKFHFKFPPCLPRFPDHQLLNAKHNTCPTIQLLWGWHADTFAINAPHK